MMNIEKYEWEADHKESQGWTTYLVCILFKRDPGLAI